MNNVRTPLACLLVFALAGAHAQAPVTRAQVTADYQEALRTGDVLAPGDSGMKLNELAPDRYPKTTPAPARTRADVVAELRAAIRSGDVFATGDSGLMENEAYPQRYPMAAAGSTSREQVRTETMAAIRTGDILATGDSGLKLNEQFPQRYEKALADSRTLAAAAPRTEPRLQ